MQRPVPVIFSNKTKSKHRNQRRIRRKRKHNKPTMPHNRENKGIFAELLVPTAPSTTSSTHGSKLWLQTYENIVRWQLDHQACYWRNVAQNLKSENQKLLERLQFYEENKETSGEEEEDEDDCKWSSSSEEIKEEPEDVDEGYLNFMEVTRKHQENIKKLKGEALDKVEEV